MLNEELSFGKVPKIELTQYEEEEKKQTSKKGPLIEQETIA